MRCIRRTKNKKFRVQVYRYDGIYKREIYVVSEKPTGYKVDLIQNNGRIQLQKTFDTLEEAIWWRDLKCPLLPPITSPTVFRHKK